MARSSRKVVLETERGYSPFRPISVPEIRLKTILVPVDFSECSRKAYHYAISFAKQFNAEIILLHIVEIVPPGITAYDPVRLEADAREAATKEMAEWRRETQAEEFTKAVLRSGASVAQDIIRAAEDANVDLIVIGNHGHAGLSRFLLGSTAERVVRHAPCPVFVVRQSEHDFLVEESSRKTS
jgi:nucleotide-binding universal stress UspA family protein